MMPAADGRTAQNGDIELCYELRGEGQPLLLLHGFTRGDWESRVTP